MSDYLDEIQGHIGFARADADALRAFLPTAAPHFARITERFYAHIYHHPIARAVLESGQVPIERFERLLVTWMRSGLEGPHDDRYLRWRSRIGRLHRHNQLPPRLMLTAMSTIRGDFCAVCERAYADDADTRRRVATALHKLFDMELAIMLECYREDAAGELQTLVHTVQALLLALDERGRVLMANPAVAATVGVPADALVGASWLDRFVPEADRVSVRRVFARLLAGERNIGHDYRIIARGPDGRSIERHVRWQASPAHGDDGRVRIYASGLDVTEARALELHARVSDRLAVVGTLTAGIAHEVRNPLNSALLQFELLERRIGAARADPRFSDPIGRVKSEIQRLSRLVDDFLDTARPTALSVVPLDGIGSPDDVIVLHRRGATAASSERPRARAGRRMREDARMKVYGSTKPWTRDCRPRWLLAELDVPFERVVVDIFSGEGRKPEHLARHPLGKLPVVETGSVRMWESGAAVTYLAETYGNGALVPPAGTPERAAYYQWMFFAAATLEPVTTKLMVHKIFRAGKEGSQEAYEATLADFDKVRVALEPALEPGPFILGERFTAADIMLGTSLYWANLTGALDDRPVTRDYFARLAERPAFQRTYAEA